MPPVTDFISIDPSPSFSKIIDGYKAQVRELVGEQQYLSEPPHMTAYLACFSEGSQVSAAAARLAQQLNAFEIAITGWHVFDADPMTQRRTLVVDFTPACQAYLRTLQMQIAEALAGTYDTEATLARYAAAFDKFSEVQRQAVRRVGFPFIGDDWHPHFTIASIDPAAWPVVSESLLGNPPSGVSVCSSLTHYRVIDGESHPISTFDLKRVENVSA
ncbi:2'-5' RNA ligase family protein [Blastopirellula marina]|uniref:2'-5' RNA ligase n=1 Tax=Blastopirellula marina TaxID=124 RepID=A0A2S8F9P4_9BACT|nr:2'-5' RNA ligase family protein [Blastopirellula marina]PQO28865.1 hypothetical protein C5Y98_24185 [Blastopirellula marina]PTL42138.1 hypothetical protein C5Y97_24200 [Blastopirellula marina]